MKDKKFKISFYGEFTDKALEKDFFDYEIGRSVKYVRPIVLILGILFMLFIIPDYFLIQNTDILRVIFSIRAVFLLLTLALFLFIGRIRDFKRYALLITILEIVCAVLFLLIYWLYESPDFLIQAMGVIVILIGIYLAPNRWIYMLLASATTSIAFIAISAVMNRAVEPSHFSAGVVYIFIVMVLSGISSYQTGYYKRVQYADSRELKRVSATDSLTGIYNRGKLNEELSKWVEYSHRYEIPLSMTIFDFDDFKKFNDKYGHLAGDQVIVDTVGIIKDTIRQSDIFARWGGEEFVLLLPNTDLSPAKELIERLRLMISRHVYEYGERVTCSFGLATLAAGETDDSFLRRADRLLYAAKEAGKNTVAY